MARINVVPLWHLIVDFIKTRTQKWLMQIVDWNVPFFLFVQFFWLRTCINKMENSTDHNSRIKNNNGKYFDRSLKSTEMTLNLFEFDLGSVEAWIFQISVSLVCYLHCDSIRFGSFDKSSTKHIWYFSISHVFRFFVLNQNRKIIVNK